MVILIIADISYVFIVYQVLYTGLHLILQWTQ